MDAESILEETNAPCATIADALELALQCEHALTAATDACARAKVEALAEQDSDSDSDDDGRAAALLPRAKAEVDEAARL